ncbi:MAG: 50S ribosome-binding GTPase [Pirellulales bacterium]|nr:50S ribosome-binding GTPase [Pirellulales bacterium]
MAALDDTIVAIASPPGGAARGIVRVSGSEVVASLRPYFRTAREFPSWQVAHPTAISGSLCLPGLASPLPCELYLWPQGHSYTGDPVAEIHTLGSGPLLEAVLQAVCDAGARLAEPGEFTLRAFLTGRIDLTQAEAVLGVIDAADPAQLDVALSQLAGGLAGPLGALRDALLELLAHLEAGFDFADEDLSFITADELKRQLREASRTVAQLAGQMRSRNESAATPRVTLVGRPNTGKSSLFNALARRAGALVSGLPGTTRDYLVAELDLDGVKCQLIDTAGLAGGPSDPADLARTPTGVEQAAQAAASEQYRRAHIHVLCLDCTRPADPWERDELARPVKNERVVVLTKIDLARNPEQVPNSVPTSSLTGSGIDALREELRGALLRVAASDSGAVAGTAVRCGRSLRLAAASLDRARELAATDGREELIAAEVRVALDELGKVVGAVYSDDVLERIFSRFCIGK